MFLHLPSEFLRGREWWLFSRGFQDDEICKYDESYPTVWRDWRGTEKRKSSLHLCWQVRLVLKLKINSRLLCLVCKFDNLPFQGMRGCIGCGWTMELLRKWLTTQRPAQVWIWCNEMCCYQEKSLFHMITIFGQQQKLHLWFSLWIDILLSGFQTTDWISLWGGCACCGMWGWLHIYLLRKRRNHPVI